MPRTPQRPRQLQWQVFRGRDALDRRLLTPSALRSSAWQRLLRGVYADSRLETDHLLRCQAAALLIPAGAAIAGPSAAFLHGVESAAAPDDPVHVLVAPRHRFGPMQGVSIHVAEHRDGHVTIRHGLRCTNPIRTAWDIAQWRTVTGAVPILDAMLGAGLVTAGELGLHAGRARAAGARGARRAIRAFRLADGRAQSPPESVLRVRLVLRGVPPPVPQYAVTVRSGRVLHPDLAWPAYRVALEYDGGYHAEPDRIHLDRRRLNELVDAGWLVLHATSRRLHREFEGLLREVRAALRSRGAPI